MKKNIPGILLMIITIILSIVSWLLLPDTVAVQIGIDGQVSNTMPKLFAIAIPSIVSIGGIAVSLNKKESRTKGYVLSLVGIGIMVFSLFINLQKTWV